jgi:DNA-binding MarR family transcriptional regulator
MGDADLTMRIVVHGLRGMKSREQLWQDLFSVATENLDVWRRDVAEAIGLPFSRYRALKRIAIAPITLRELAEAMGIDAPATTVIVNDLDDRGLVLREPHPEDRRAKVVSLTNAGKRLLRSALAVPVHAPAAFATLTNEDLVTLERIIDRLRSR